MFDAARAAGMELFVAEGYRTREEQKQMMEERVQLYLDGGADQTSAKKMAEGFVALPGTSEHELGLAVDINADTSVVSSEEVYNWLAENAWKYGFINRYPLDKSEITGINYEPWHYRYVGKKAAGEMQKSGQCLEEYLGETD